MSLRGELNFFMRSRGDCFLFWMCEATNFFFLSLRPNFINLAHQFIQSFLKRWILDNKIKLIWACLKEINKFSEINNNNKEKYYLNLEKYQAFCLPSCVRIMLIKTKIKAPWSQLQPNNQGRIFLLDTKSENGDPLFAAVTV